LIDGGPYKTLRRHLSGHGLTPDQYRERYGLKADNPMIAPAYAEVGRAMAKKIGLGRSPGTDTPPSEATAPAARQMKRGRKPTGDME
jgi:predicted transcriptional regulator